MKPSMGSVIHYVDDRGEAWPAVVRASYEHDADIVDLSALTTQPEAVQADGVRRDDARRPDSWHWPERSLGSGRPDRERNIEDVHRLVDELTARRNDLARRQRAAMRERADLEYDRMAADLDAVDAEISSALERLSP